MINTANMKSLAPAKDKISFFEIINYVIPIFISSPWMCIDMNAPQWYNIMWQEENIILSHEETSLIIFSTTREWKG
jgi:hypothetical protein